ncbi:MAG: hypothetical protein NC187_04955 [Candidatus Amulumruptor caecigallinarius]|nr:hypothetical protein [Candidatus Amulumruptor caecigallinarius]MCM1396821.1 hypothetical protein [Candidatus Amulumruptor caecigallinarius]MCM1454235.1 hypothetical protein [bacterium]
MKKALLTLVITLTTLLSASAQHYRGFLDFNLSYPIANSDGMKFENAGGLTIGGTTSHGVQLNKLFLGAGLGAIFNPSSYGVGMPVFADVRWDFFSLRTTNIFVGCKIGAIFNVGDDSYGISLDGPQQGNIEVADGQWTNYSGYGWAGYGGIYMQPSVGVRFRINHTMGINIALSYLPLRFKTETEYHTNSVWDSNHNNVIVPSVWWTEYSKFWSHRIALSVGLDF